MTSNDAAIKPDENISATLPIVENDDKFDMLKQETYLNWYHNSPKLMFGEHMASFEIDDINEEFYIQKAEQELRETPEIMDLGFKELTELIATDPDLFILNSKTLYTIFLRRCKWYANSAFSLMKQFYKFRLIYPHVYKDLLPSKQMIALCSGVICPLPLRNINGCRLLFIETQKWKPQEVPIEDLFKCLIIFIYSAVMEPKTQIAGFHIILDCEALTLSQVTHITISFAKMITHFAQNCLLLRLKAIHIINQNIMFNMAFAIFKPFLQEKFRKIIFFHGTNKESLMKCSFTNESMLIIKHGGKLEMPDQSFGTTIWQNMLSNESFIKYESELGYKAVNR